MSQQDTLNKIPDAHQKHDDFADIINSLTRKDLKDLSKCFDQITITGYDCLTGLDHNGCTFEEVLGKCNTLPSCIKFTDTKTPFTEILPNELIDLPSIQAIDISENGFHKIHKYYTK